MARSSKIGGGEMFRTDVGRPGGPPGVLYNGQRFSFQRVIPERGIDHPIPFQRTKCPIRKDLFLPTHRARLAFTEQPLPLHCDTDKKGNNILGKERHFSLYRKKNTLYEAIKETHQQLSTEERLKQNVSKLRAIPCILQSS